MQTTSIITVPFHVGDFLSGTMHMDTLEKGAYIMLIMAHYQAGENGLPNDDKKLANISGVSMKIWKRIRPTMAEKFQISDTKWKSKKCVEVLQKVHEKSSAQRAKALKKNKPCDAAAEPRQSQPKPKPNNSIIINNNTLEFPNFIDAKIWDDFVKHRGGNKFTKLARTRILNQLENWYHEGHDPNDILNKSIMNGWKGVFEPKEKTKGNSVNDELAEFLARK